MCNLRYECVIYVTIAKIYFVTTFTDIFTNEQVKITHCVIYVLKIRTQ